MAEMYRISGERLKGFADQVRRISGVEGELTPEQMETNLLNVTPLGEYPKAEEWEFGQGEQVYENGITSTTLSNATSGNYTSGWKFKAVEAFAIVGFRIGKGNTGTVYLWDSEGNEKCAISSGFATDTDDWLSVYLDKPINIGIGEECTVGRKTSANSMTKGRTMSRYYTKFNSKVSDVSFVSTSETGICPTGATSSSWAVDIIIGSVQAELPDDYQIQRTTMDDIAEEVQRISGATEKLTTAQMVEGLSEVEVLEDYEEVAF